MIKQVFTLLKIGRKFSFLAYNSMPTGFFLKIKYKIAKKLVFNKARKRFGGKIKYFISGGAPLSKDLAGFFHSLDLLILEGYGLTETSPVLTCNSPNHFKFGTVGKPLDNVEIKLAEDGEILAKAPSVMLGYYNKENETRLYFKVNEIGGSDQENDGDGYFCVFEKYDTRKVEDTDVKF